MRVHLYSICWNEERLLPFFFRHYDSIIDRYVVYDDGSTDRTLDLLAAHPRVEIRRFSRAIPDSYVASAQQIHNHAWKESRGTADWVIISAVDEHLFHADLGNYLAQCRASGVTLAPALGYQMLTNAFPESSEVLSRDRTRGTPCLLFSKLCAFNPIAIDETNYGPGRHSARPTGHVTYPPRDELLNLHYKYLGLNYVEQRHAFLRTGLGTLDRKNEWGHHYHHGREELRSEIDELERYSVNISDPDYEPARDHVLPRWWRLPKRGRRLLQLESGWLLRINGETAVPSEAIVGWVDNISEEGGDYRIDGWACDLDRPTRALEVAAFSGNVLLGSVTTTLDRPDIEAATGISGAQKGFSFYVSREQFQSGQVAFFGTSEHRFNRLLHTPGSPATPFRSS